MDDRPLLIGLTRVSTEKQAVSGLGREDQLKAIEIYRATNKGELIQTYEETESGKHNDIASRPTLVEAADHALEVDATLVFARFDRLVRSVSVLVHLRDRKVKFVACDNPHANNLTINILVAVAEYEAEMIGKRTRVRWKPTGRASTSPSGSGSCTWTESRPRSPRPPGASWEPSWSNVGT